MKFVHLIYLSFFIIMVESKEDVHIIAIYNDKDDEAQLAYSYFYKKKLHRDRNAKIPPHCIYTITFQKESTNLMFKVRSYKFLGFYTVLPVHRPVLHSECFKIYDKMSFFTQCESVPCIAINFDERMNEVSGTNIICF